MGWYSGRPYELEPLPQKEEAIEFLRFAGNNPSHIYNEALQAFNCGKVKWAIKLCDYLIETENLLLKTKILKAQCLEKLSESQTSFGGRNWLLTAAMEIRGDLVVKPTKEQIMERIYSMSIPDLFQMMTTMLDAKKTENVTEEAHFEFSDISKYFVLKVGHLI